MDLKGLIQRELGEGLTEEELATAVGVSAQTIVNILADELPQDPAIWETFARHFQNESRDRPGVKCQKNEEMEKDEDLHFFVRSASKNVC